MVIRPEPFGGIRLRRHILISLLVQVIGHMRVLFIFHISKFAFSGVFLPLDDILFTDRQIFLLLRLRIIGLEEITHCVYLSSHDFIDCHALSFVLWPIGRSLRLLHLSFALHWRWNAHGGLLLLDHLCHHLRLRFGCKRLNWGLTLWHIVHIPVLLVDAHFLFYLHLHTDLLWLSLNYSFKAAWCRIPGLGSLIAAALLHCGW